MTGGRGVLRSAWMLYHFVGSSRSERVYLVVMSAGFRAIAASFRVARRWIRGPAGRARNPPTVDEDPRPVKAWPTVRRMSIQEITITGSDAGTARATLPNRAPSALPSTPGPP